jgi:mannose-6-phosphate isomerase-like protein (cupin superfamily)
MDKVNLSQKFGLLSEHCSPRIVGEVNDHYVKVAKVLGEIVWHAHDEEDELFLIVKGRLTIRFRDRDPIELGPGELLVVPKGVEHSPVATEEVECVLVEPKGTAHTGDVQAEMTVPIEEQTWI